jgi:tetratricopeptide (TPR) repeat protein
LIRQFHGTISPAQAVDFLRDRKLPGGIFAGNGNRGTLNAFIATHATVMDLTAGIFWAASPPNQLGKFVAFDVNDFSHELPDLTIPADPVLASGEYDRAREAQKDLAAGQAALKSENAQTALDLAQKAETLNPGYYQNSFLTGRACLVLGKRDEAKTALEKALAEQPAFLKEKMAIEDLLRQATGVK